MKLSTILTFLFLLSATVSPLPMPAAGNVSPPANADRLVSLNFNNVDIGVFINFVSELTGKNFIVDPRVRGNVTVILPTPISVADMYAVFASVLEVHGFSLVGTGAAVKIVPSSEARSMNIATASSPAEPPPSDELITQIVPLAFAEASEMKRLLTPLVSRTALLGEYGPGNALIVTDSASNVRRLLSVIRELDIAGSAREMQFIPLQHADSTRLVEVLKGLFQTPASSSKTQPVKTAGFVADERTNSLIAIAGKTDLERAVDLIRLLDKDLPRDRGKIRVYYLENARAEELVKTLQELSDRGGAGQGPGETGPVLSNTTKYQADPATNSLIVAAGSDEDFQLLEGILNRLDGPRAMVYLEVLILEVSAQKDFRLGVEWTAVRESQIDGRKAAVGAGFVNPAAESALPALVEGGLPSGFSVGVFTEKISIAGVDFNNIAALLQAFKSEAGLDILSNPQIVATDNEEAKINVGRNIPFQTSTSTTDNETFNSFEYRDVGTSLTITPQISENRSVNLKIGLEVTMLESTTDFRPTTLKRTVDTSVLVNDGGTVVIGGLVEDSPSVSEFKVPLLGDIPLLGRLFKFESQSRRKSNLLIFVTPRVMTNPKQQAELGEGLPNLTESSGWGAVGE